MKLFELLETAIKTQDIIINESSQFCMVYSKRYQCFVWCDRSGKAKKNILDMSGYDRVLLSPKLLAKEKWYLLECNVNWRNRNILKTNSIIDTNGLRVEYTTEDGSVYSLNDLDDNILVGILKEKGYTITKTL